jgi:hypothetical protein
VSIYRLISSIFILQSSLLGYEDSDIDGVADSIDLCPDTSFDKLVDENGCPENEHYLGSVTLQLSNDIALDEDNNQITNYNFFGSYSYKKWSFSLSNTQQTTYDSNNNGSTDSGDLYLNLAYKFNYSNFQTNLNFGVKIATADENIGTGENDYFGSIDMNYFINDKQTLFAQFGYTMIGDSPIITYQDILAYSLGTGYMVNTQWYSSIAYDNSESIYNNAKNYQSLSWLNNYSFLDNYFISVNYIYGLDNLSYPHTFSLKLGATFE